MGKRKRTTPNSSISREEFHKTNSKLAEAITSLTRTTESFETYVTELQIHEYTDTTRGKLIPICSTIVAVLSLFLSGYSVKQSKEQWDQSGTKIQYVLKVPMKNSSKTYLEDASGRKTAVQETASTQQQILFTNTGRLSTTVVTVEVTDSRGRTYNSTCRNQELTIAPGESKLLIASFPSKDISDITELKATLASGIVLEADPLDTDGAALDAAFDYATRHANDSTIATCDVTGS